ncbi:hypothetical protein [Shewanella sp.]|uniref:hypothetical protein n=1 Tax=Shewanella sp. TaxID=50422 RepID=UPI002612A693|nr:hypothetical protein [Shewanella sp.]
MTNQLTAKAFRGELTADYKLLPCSLPFGPTFGRSKWLPTILWRAANPELISGDNSAEALLKRIKAERAREVSSQNQNTQSMQCVLIVSQ